MMISKNWLSQYTDLHNITPEELAGKLKMSTVEVEGIKKQGENLENIVVGKVLKCEKHPNADKLKVCEVDVGVGVENLQTLQVVCGGSNVREGMLVALAKVGAKVRWHGEGELIELKSTTIRGVESQGMICASTEIGLGEMFPLNDEKEILDMGVILSGAKDPLNRGERDSSVATLLQNDKKEKIIGKSLADVLGLDDAILEVDNKSLSNRPDLWGHYGMAREAAVLFSKKLESYHRQGGVPLGRDKVIKLESEKEVKLSVKIEDVKLCPRYMAVAMSGVKVGESPLWLKQKLLNVGLRPINNIVDITNYVMMDLGQPMHAFDKSKACPEQSRRVKSQKSKVTVVVRMAREGERFMTLDGVERTLEPSMLVIADEEKTIALAGVMGGEESGISETTETIIFESANFDAVTTRKTSAKLGLRTDSSMRFEKSLDPNLCELALGKAVELTLLLCPEAKVASKIVDKANFSLATGPITVPAEVFEKKLGVAIPIKTTVEILERLGFGVKEKKDELLITIPTWRATKDISIAEDIVEEVARVYGYEKIPVTLPVFAINPPEILPLLKTERKTREAMVKGLRYTEVYNYSFVRPSMVQKFGNDASKYLQLDNPISEERPLVRRNLLVNLLENVKKNIDVYPELRLMEIGKVYRAEVSGQRASANGDDLLPRQDTWVAAVYSRKRDEIPFFQARRAAEHLFSYLGIELELTPMSETLPWQHSTRAGAITVQGKEVGSVYELHPLAQSNLNIEVRAAVMEVNLTALSDIVSAPKKYEPVSQFPSVERDLAILVKKEITYKQISTAVSGFEPILASVELFDVYEGENMGDGYKSMAFHFTYRNPERTLTAEEVDSAHKKIIELLKNRFNAAVR